MHRPHHPSSRLWLLLAAALLCCGRPGKDDRGAGRPHRAEEPVGRDGLLTRYGANADGDLDRLVLVQGADSLTVRFPPHAARALLSLAPPPVPVHVDIRNGGRPPGRGGWQLVSIRRGGQTLRLSDLGPPPPRVGGKAEVTGPVAGFAADPQGRLRSFTIGNTRVNVPGPAAPGLADALRRGDRVTASGYWRNEASGFVNEGGLRVLRLSAITINGTTYRIE